MTELNVTETTGTAPAINGDTAVVDVVDGRKLTLTYPGPLAQYELVLALGSDASENTRFVQMCLPLIYLTAIDETPVQLPTSLLQVKALIGRLGHKGLAALAKGVKLFDEKDDVDAAKK
ncbi:hypothetical protein [Paraburkholderia nemoris]|uniref:hypothetical protein n=1 Tax=Paraburkholderia nemoris TaxID=2793076 RepID=UPI001B04847C|nr:hypothetical protein [Paraburkholderia nemoris]CAE6838248.1 hypothetical protein R75777_06939 [Paraburkholderia nemoris]